MNWDQMLGKWLQIKGGFRQKWGRLIDDDLQVIAGSKDKVIGRARERYGTLKGEAQRQLSTIESNRLSQLSLAHPTRAHSSLRIKASQFEGKLRNLPWWKKKKEV